MSENNFDEWITYLEANQMAQNDRLNELADTVGVLLNRLGAMQERIDLLETELAKASAPDPRIAETIDSIRNALEALDAGSVRQLATPVIADLSPDYGLGRSKSC